MGNKEHVIIDADHPEWGRVCGNAIVLERYGNRVLVCAESISANIIIKQSEINRRENASHPNS